MKKRIFGFEVQDIAEIAILCALAIICDRFIKIPIASTGGSINLSMAPLYVIALRHGPFKGFIAGGIVFGLITCLFDGYGLLCYPLEYLISFGSVAILGIFGRYINQSFKKDTKNIFICYGILVSSIIVAAVIRFFCASIDSVILWEYSWKAAFTYNISYVFISAGGVLILMCLLFPTIKMLNKVFSTSYLE